MNIFSTPSNTKRRAIKRRRALGNGNKGTNSTFVQEGRGIYYTKYGRGGLVMAAGEKSEDQGGKGKKDEIA